MGKGASFLLLAGLILATGFAGGYLVGQGGGAAAPPDDVPRLDRHHASARAEAPPTRLPAPEGPELEGALTQQLVPLREALALIPDPVVARGDGTITGVVRTKEGDPLGGVEIRADPRHESRRESRRDADAEDEDLAAEVRAWVLRRREAELARRTTTTGPDGTFRLTEIGDTPYSVYAACDGYRIGRSDEAGRYPEAGAELVFEATRIHEVELRITLPDGSEPEKASVMFKAGNRSWGKNWTAATRRVEVDPGVYQVTAKSGEAQEYRSEPQLLDVTAEGPAPVLVVALRSHPVLRGRLRFPEGQSFEMATVRVAPLPDGQAADPALLGSGARQTWVHRNQLGRAGADFTFDDLSPGRYLLGVAAGQGTILATKAVELGDGLTEVELEVPPLARDLYVVARITGPDGKPIPDAQLQSGYRAGNGAGSSGANVVRLGDGSVQVLHPHEAGAAGEVTCWLRASDARYGVQHVDYDPAKTREIEIRFDAPAVAALQVAGVEGSRYAGRVQARLLAPGLDAWRGEIAQAEVDAQGTAQFGAVQPGAYDLTLTLGDRGPFSAEVLREAVRVGSGNVTLRAVLPTLYVVELENVAGPAFVQEKREGRGHSSHRQVTAAGEGRGIVDGLTAGTYTAYSGGRRAEFTVPGTTRVRLEANE